MKKITAILLLPLCLVALVWHLQSRQKDGPISSSVGRSLAADSTPLDLKDDAPLLKDEKPKEIKITKNRPFITSKDEVLKRDTIFQKLAPKITSMSTRVFWLKGQKLNIAQNYRAVSKERYRESMGRKISSVNQHYIIQGKSGLPVVQDPVKKIKGMATGHIIVKAKADADLSELARKYKLTVHHSVPHLNIISFIPESEEKLLETSVKLSESPLLDSVKLDISYGGPRAK